MQIAWQYWLTYDSVSCLECGLGLHFSPMYCAHVLPKATWRKMKNHPLNMIPLCEKDHRRFDSGDFKNMLMFESVSKLKTKLKQSYDSRTFYFSMEELRRLKRGVLCPLHRVVHLHLSGRQPGSS